MTYKKLWNLILQNRYYFLILITVLFFFWPIFKGQIPFPGDLLINENPYRNLSVLGFSPGGYPNKAQGADVIKEIYPWRYFSISQLKNGEIPFWNPYNFSGNPQIANFQTAFFYPINILYFIFSFNIAWTIIILLEPFLAGLFMYLFLSKGLLLKKLSSFMGAIAFAFSSYMVVWIEYGNIGHTLLWLPLALLFVKRITEKASAFNLLLLTTTLTLSILAGYIQGVFYIYILCFVYFVFLITFHKAKNNRTKKIIVFISGIILSLILSAFQLLPTYELFQQSTRGSYSIGQISNLLSPPYYLITAFVPDFFGHPATRNYWIEGTYIERVMYGGIATLFFALYGVFRSKILEKKLFLFTGISSLVLVTNLPFVKFFYLIPIPVISTTIPTRGLSIFIFSLIILASMGVDYWLSNKEKKSLIPIAFLSIYVLFWLAVIMLPKFDLINAQNIKISQRNLLLPSLLAILTVFTFYFGKKTKLSTIFLFFILIFDLFYFFNKITPFSPKELIYPKTPVVSFLQKNAGINRFWGYGSAYIPPNYQSVDRTYSPEGNDPLHVGSYGELLASSNDGVLPDVLPRPDANIAPGFGNEELKNNFYRQRILNLLGVKYVLNKNDYLPVEYIHDLETFSKDKFQLVWQNAPWQIYENKQALPRFFLTGDYKVIPEKTSVLKAIYNKDFDIRKTLVLSEKPKLSINEEASGIVNLISYSPNKIVFVTKNTGNLLLFLSDNYYLGWKAYIDDKEAKIYRADYAFRAVPVPKGEHKVMMIYTPLSFNLGLKISLIGFLILVGLLFKIRIYEKEK